MKRMRLILGATICLLSMGLALNTTMTTSEWTEYEVGQICGSMVTGVLGLILIPWTRG